MNEITKIHLGRQAFTIAVDAHKALQDYLREIKREVGSRGSDVVEEVELRMAELLSERGITGDKVVLAPDVDYLKEQLGSPKDFKEEDDDEAPREQPADDGKQSKRLFRDTDNAMLAGVCAGLGKYFGVDATIVRLLFLALLFFGGSGVLLYIVLWLIVPEAKTTSDKLHMQGKSVTVESLKELVDRADVEGAAKRAGKKVEPVALLIVKVLLGVIGVGVIAVACSILIGVAATAILGFTSQGAMLGGEKIFPVGTKEAWLLFSGLTAMAVLGLFCLFGGIGMVVRKWKIPGWVSGALVGVFLLSVASTGALVVDSVPRIRDRYEAMHHTSTIMTAPFKKLNLYGQNGVGTHYIYHPSNEYKVEYRYIGKQPSTTFNKGVKDDTLTLDMGEIKHKNCDWLCIDGDEGLAVTIIYAPSLDAVTLRGNDARFENDSPFAQSDISFDIDSTAGLDLHYINPKKVKLTANPDQTYSTLQITGLNSNAFVQDELTSWGQNFTLSRATEVEFNTNANCEVSEMMLNMLSYPEKFTLNGRVFPTKGDLKAEQRTGHEMMYNNEGQAINTNPALQHSPYNCVQVN
jgi:phage shock protein PspC (stress-responsive transcriptional regulator)